MQGMKVNIYSSFVVVVLLVLFCLPKFGKSEIDQIAKVPAYIKDTTINENEKKALDELRERVAPLNTNSHHLLKNDLFLIRWLRRESFDVDSAERLIKKHLKWRAQMGVDKLKDQDWSDMERLVPYSLLPRDKEGKPALYLNLGDWNLREVTISGKSERFQNYATKILDEGVNLIISLGEKYENVTQGHILMNLKGLNLIQHLCPLCIRLNFNLINLVNTHYVGWVETFIHINIPEVALPVISASRAILHPIIRKSIKDYGTNRNAWWKELTRYYDVSQIPEELGGGLVLEDKDENEFRALRI